MDSKKCGEAGSDGTPQRSSLANLQSRADYSNEVPTKNSNLPTALNFNSTRPFDSKSVNYCLRLESLFGDFFVAPPIVAFDSIFGTQK